MQDDFRGVSEQKLAEEVSALKTVINSGKFREAAGSTFQVSPEALIKLSDEVGVDPSDKRGRPTFDLMISPDPLTLRVANRLYPELKRMGFKPVFIIGQYKMPNTMKHPQMEELSFQTRVFNQVVFDTLRTSVPDSTQQFLTPTHLKHVKGLKVLDDVSSVNEQAILSYIEDETKRVGVAHSFRLYDLIGIPFIELFAQVDKEQRKTLWGQDDRHSRNTCFTSDYSDSIHGNTENKDNGLRRSLATNIHPDLYHHGVIPPFWTQY